MTLSSANKVLVFGITAILLLVLAGVFFNILGFKTNVLSVAAAQAQDAQVAQGDVAVTSCSPNFSVNENKTFSTKKGDIVIFTCTLANKGSAEATVLLSGERSGDGVASSTAATSVSLSVVIPPGGTAKAEVPFLALFENGTYKYEITLKNLSDGESFGSPLYFTSTLDSQTIRIVSATTDKNVYAPGEIGSIFLTIATSSQGTENGEATPFFLDAALKEKDGKICSYVISDRQIASAEDRIFFSVPVALSGCSATTLEIILKDNGGFSQDSHDIPLVVLVPNPFTAKLLTLSLLAIVALAALAWVIWTKRFRRNKVTTL